MNGKRLIALVLSILLALSLAGCSGQRDDHGESGSSAAGTTEEQTTVPQTNEDGSLVKPKNAVTVSDDTQVIVHSDTYLLEIGDRLMEQYGNAYQKMAVYAEDLNKLKTQLPDAKVYCLMAPTAVEFYAPAKYNSGMSKSQYEGISYIYERLDGITPVDAYTEIAAHTDEYLYFRSDHHWTQRGAYYAYLAFAKSAEFTPVNKDDLQTGRLSPFLGSLYKENKTAALENNPDYVEYFMPLVNTTATASERDAAMTDSYSIKVINTEITSSNKYLAFVGGDHGVVKITTDAQSERSIVVIKESYANAFVPWLCANYRTIYVLDPRQLTVNLSDFVKTNSIGEVLFLNYMYIPTNAKFMTALEEMG